MAKRRRSRARDFLWLCGLLGLLWAIEGVDQLLLAGRLDAFGIVPRERSALPGILLAPFLHVGYAHLASNSVPLLVLGGLVMLRGRREFIAVSLWVIVLAGTGVWLLARPDTLHLGASGVIFGYLGFLLGAGIVERSLPAVLLALLATFLYGGMLWGVLPQRPGVSWEGHLCGLLAGGATARWLTPPRR